MARLETREELIKVGSDLIARGGFGQTGIEKILKKAKVPKGSFYHHFSSKEDFGLAVIDSFGAAMVAHVRDELADDERAPLERLRALFESGASSIRRNECKQGCLMGDLGQELAHQNEAFRKRLEQVFDQWKAEVARCLQAARDRGELAKSANPAALAGFILSGWEGAILRAKVEHSVEPVEQFIAILFNQLLTNPGQ